MKRAPFILIVLIAGAGAALYWTNPDIKVKFDSWIGVTQIDTVQNEIQTDSASNAPRRIEKAKRKKIPKTIKPGEYARLDKYASDTPKKYSNDKRALAEYLKKPANNDLEKARLIYSWIATHIRYDDDSFNSGNYGDQNADGVLASRKGVCEGFSTLFQELGLQMGLEVEKISGYSKGYGYKAGKKFKDTNHAWNAVKIDGTWQLLDVTWGSSESETTSKGLKSKMKLDPYWFIVPPEEFIFSHLPEDTQWQLISPAITTHQFEDLPFIADSFFKMGLGSKEILTKGIAKEVTEFAETSPIDYPVKGVDLPIVKKIELGREYTFSIESEYLENVVLIDGKEWIYLKKEGNLFKIKHAPKGGKLNVSVKINWYDKEVWTIIKYDVVDAKKLTATASVP